jgi:formylglycine-generating enzyme required for sulfatase activity
MGSDPKWDSQAYDGEKPQQRVTLAAFQIGTYPVTVAEYACAVQAKAVREPPRGLRMDWLTQLKQLDHPVVCISWQDATAYAAWLAEVTGQSWRLPTEAEWEMAARGTDGRIYPWGDGFDTTHCNTDESDIKTTTPVGRYPTGASPCGPQEMAGNVWEWTSSLYKPYPYRADDGRERVDATGDRVLRGGSVDDVARNARTACRFGDSPAGISSVFGLRLALAPGRTGL